MADKDNLTRQFEEEKRALTLKLTKALKENATLYERLADLDINLSMKTSDLRKEIEDLNEERDGLLKENEGLLHELSAKDEKIQEILRSLDQTEFRFEDMQRQLRIGREHMEQFELKHADLESHYRTALRDLEHLRTLLREQGGEIPAGEEGLFLPPPEPTIMDAEVLEEQTAYAMDASVINEQMRQYEARIEELVEERVAITAHKDREIAALNELIEELREQSAWFNEEKIRLEGRITEKDAKIAVLESSVDAGEAAPAPLTEVSADRDGEIGRLKARYEEARSELEGREKALHDMEAKLKSVTQDKTGLEKAFTKAQEELERLSSRLSEEDSATLMELEQQFTAAREKASLAEQALLEKDRDLTALQRRLEESADFSTSLEGVIEEKNRALAETESRLSEALQQLSSLTESLTGKERFITDLEQRLHSQHTTLQERDNAAGDSEQKLKTTLERVELLERQLLEKERALSQFDGSRNLYENQLIEKSRALSEADRRAREMEERIASLEGLLSEKDVLLSRLRRDFELREDMIQERSEAESMLIDARERMAAFERIISEKDSALLRAEKDLAEREQLIQARSLALSEAMQRLSEVEQRAASIENALNDARVRVQNLEHDLSSGQEAIRELEGQKEALLLQAEEADSRETAYHALIERLRLLESMLSQEQLLKERLENSLRVKDSTLEDLKTYYESEREKFRAEKERLDAELHTAEEELRRLTSTVSEKGEEITALRTSLSSRQVLIREQEAAVERLTAAARELEGQLKSSTEEWLRQKEHLENTLGIKDYELKTFIQRNEAVETLLSEARQKSTSLEHLLAEEERRIEELEKTVGEYKVLASEKQALQDRLAEALQETDPLKNLRDFFSGEIESLRQEQEKLKEESAAHRAAMRGDIEGAFSKLSENTMKLEHTISEGVNLAKKLEEISTGALIDQLPLMQKRRAPRSGPSLKKAAVFALIVLLSIAGIVAFRERLYHTLFPARQAAVQQTPAVTDAAWATGVKSTQNGPYTISLIFLNRESVGVLGLSDKITESVLLENYCGLTEIKAEGGCIPKEFIASIEKNIFFSDEEGKAVAINPLGPLSDELKAVYKVTACAGKPGAVYLKAFVTVRKDPGIKSLVVRGLTEGPPITLQ